MAIQIQFNTLIVRCETLRRKYPGGVEGYVRDLGGPGPVLRCDGDLFATGSMAGFDRDLDLLTGHGMRVLDEEGRADEIALLSEVDDPRVHCPWLDFGEAREPPLLFAFLRSAGFESNPRVAVYAGWLESLPNKRLMARLNYLFGHTAHLPERVFPRFPGILSLDSVETFVNPLSSRDPDWLSESGAREAEPEESIAEVIRGLKAKGRRDWAEFLRSLPLDAEATIRGIQRRQRLTRWEAYLAWLPQDARDEIREIEAKYNLADRGGRRPTVHAQTGDASSETVIDAIDEPDQGDDADGFDGGHGVMEMIEATERPRAVSWFRGGAMKLLRRFQRYDTFVWHDDAGLYDPPLLVKVQCRRSDGKIMVWGLEWTESEQRLYRALTGQVRNLTPEDHDWLGV